MKNDNSKSIGIFTSPFALTVVIIISIFVSGALTDLILSIMPPLSHERFAFLDAGLLIVILSPVIYYLVFKPFRSHIKELRLSEEALQASEERYRSLVESTDDSIYLVNRNCEYLFMNAKHRYRLGFIGEEYVGKAYSEFHSPEEAKIFSEELSKVFDTGSSLQHEHKSLRDGSYFLRTLSPIRGQHKEIIAVSVISKNISILKEKY